MSRKQEITKVSIVYKNDEKAKERFLDFLIHLMIENNFFRKDGVNE